MTAAGLGAFPAAGALARPPGLSLSGQFRQSGFLIGATQPRAAIAIDGQGVGRASATGFFIAGFDRDAPSTAKLTVENDDGSATHDLTITPGVYDVQAVNGLAQDQVTPSDPALLDRIRAEAARKAVGFASDVDADYFREGFALPVAYTRISSQFGGQRILNGVPNRPHYGIDLTAPIGTPIVAPAGGVVSFAETGLHFEGGLVMIDHGQGLISLYLHMSQVDVAAGQTLVRGQRLGAVGMEGRATGPHLCWRMRWRGRNLDPSLLLGAAAPPRLA